MRSVCLHSLSSHHVGSPAAYKNLALAADCKYKTVNVPSLFNGLDGNQNKALARQVQYSRIWKVKENPSKLSCIMDDDDDHDHNFTLNLLCLIFSIDNPI